MVLEKSLESPLDCKEIQPVHSEGDQPWDFFGRNDAKAETPILWPPHAKSWLIGEDSDAGRDRGQEGKGTTADEMAGWHRWLDGRESGWTLGVGWWTGRPGVLQFMGSKSQTRLSDWTELISVKYWLITCSTSTHGLPWWLNSKESACQAGDSGLISGLGRFPWRNIWQPTPVFLPEKSHGQRSLVGYGSWGHRRQRLNHNIHTFMSSYL